MNVKVLGTNCSKCKRLESRLRELVEENSIDAIVTKVTEIDEMLNYGIMMTPGLVINEEVKSVGIVPKDDQLIKWLKGE
ncbi:thioredoxin family protein [Bacteroidota bacterium]